MYEKTTINLREGDYAFIQGFAKRRGLPAALLIRHIVAQYVDNFKRDPNSLEELLDEVTL